MSRDVWVIEDDDAMRSLLDSSLRKRGFRVQAWPSAEAGLEQLGVAGPDVVLTDLNLRRPDQAGMNGITFCQRFKELRPDVPVVVVTAFGSLDTAVAAIRAGAYDFISKPVDMDTLALALERALQHKELREEVRRLREEVGGRHRDLDLIGESLPMRRLKELITRVADHPASVLITGESGTGKELVAKALHGASRWKDGPFVALNCAAMPEALLESELFGHVRGAFTDARGARAGLLARAQGGTLLLDEIGDMPLSLQPKLLRAVQERRYRPVGSDEEVSFDARIVAATNQDLDQGVAEGRFRADLLYRINVIQLDLPPLRARGNDTLLLAQHFIEAAATRSGRPVTGVSSAAAHKLLAYPWPGNVRELHNVMERAVALTQCELLTVEDLPDRLRDHTPVRASAGMALPEELVPLEEVERRYILHVLGEVGGNKTVAAQVLGLDRKTLYRKLERYDA